MSAAGRPRITLSIVSHRQNALVNALLEDLGRVCMEPIALDLTRNVADAVTLETAGFAWQITITANPKPLGFGANHNAAFRRCRTPYFCVCNPDIRLSADPFPPLLDALEDANVGLAAPLVRNPEGEVEDSVRRFPTAASLLMKLLRERRAPEYLPSGAPQPVDWAAGMFLLFRSEAFRAVGGFDERYYLYYEDVDICRRLWRAQRRVVFQPRAEVVHDARRASRRDLALMRHHAASLLRFLRG